MVQYGRPANDANRGAWVDEANGTTDIYTHIDEVSANDVDYIKSPLAPVANFYVCKLSSIEDPVANTGHTIRYRYAKNAAGGAAINLVVELRQGYVNEASPGTLIKELGNHANISETITQANVTLSVAEADSISNYADLFLRFVANQA